MLIPTSSRLAEYLLEGHIHDSLSPSEASNIPEEVWEEAYKILELMELDSQIVEAYHLINKDGKYVKTIKVLVLFNYIEEEGDIKEMLGESGFTYYGNKGGQKT